MSTGRYEPLREAGVLAPLKVVRLALEHAVSVMGLLATTEAVVTDAGDAVDADPSTASS